MTIEQLIKANNIQRVLNNLERITEHLETTKFGEHVVVMVKFSEDGKWEQIPQKVVEYWIQYNKETAKDLQEKFDKL